MSSNNLINVETVANMLGISANSVRRLAKQGLIPAGLRVGRRLIRWDREQIETYMAGLSGAGIDLGVEIEGKELA